jgi:TolB protein
MNIGKHRSRFGARISTAVVVGVLVGALAPSAGATFPARNGKIAFKRYSDAARSTSAIFVSDPDGKHERQLTHPAQGVKDDGPDWSRDGRTITFARCMVACEVWVVRADGTGARRLGPDCLRAGPGTCEFRGSPAFSPTGTIAFGHGFGSFNGDAVQNAEMAVMNADGSALRTIYAAAPYTVREAGFAWAPDGKRLAASIGNSNSASPPGRQAVYVIGADGAGGPRRVTPFGMGDGVDWSPDGRRLLFRSHAEIFGRPAGSQLYTVRPDGTGLTRLTHFKPGTFVGSSSFSPDGKWITVSLTGIGRQADIYVMRANGTDVRPVTRTRLWDTTPDWGPAR